MKVIKRNNSQVEFDITKIHDAVNAAFLDTTGAPAPQSLLMFITETFSEMEENRVIHIEEIQNTIEMILMDRGYHDVAKDYILYREEHKDNRLIRERIEYMDGYGRDGVNAATASETDANANVTTKNVANLNGEVYKSLNRKVQRYRMRKKLGVMFPECERQYEEDLERHIIYTHDESSTPVVENYCEAVTMYPLSQYGTSTLDGTQTKAPKNMSSFSGQFVNMVFLLAAQCKGAVATGEFFNFFDHYCAKEYGPDYHRRTDEQASIYPKKTIGQTIDQYFQQIIYSINQPAGNRSFQSPFTNFSYYDSNYWHALFDEFRFPDGSRPEWERVDFLQRRFMKWLNNERTKTLLTFPVETMALLSDGKDIIDKEYKEFTAEMYAEGHSFFTYISDNPNALASCCRLRNEMTDNVFSFTNGLTGVQTGSANVITLNMNRITQDWTRSMNLGREDMIRNFSYFEDSFVTYLEAILERVYKYHKAYKTLLYEVEKQGLMTASNAGYWVPEDRVLYNSYFYLADDKDISILDKFRLHGREFTELLDGGVGLHCNLEDHLSKNQCLKLIDFAIANGTSYFTFNIPNSECTNPSCHHIVKKPLETCPECGARMRQWTRIIGYLRPVECFDRFRYQEAQRRHYSKPEID